VILIFTNQYIIHLIIIFIGLGVATSNLLAYERHEDYGQNALIYKIISPTDIEIIEDTTISLEESKIYSYLEESSQLESGIFSEAQKREEEISREQYSSEAIITEDSLALVKPDLVSTEAAKITRTSLKKYEVKEGDSVGKIATNFNLSVDTILWANNLSVTSYLKLGQTLIIPPTTGILHTIKKGDTLKSIAQKYGATDATIKEFNKIDNDSLLVIGETLMVPGGRIIYTAKPRVYTAPGSATTYTAPVAVSGKMLWPIGCRHITQYFRGWRHTGVDIACAYSSPIYAAADGVVSRIQYLNYGYGYNVIIDHGNGKKTLYAHNSRIEVVVGQVVSQGEIIAREGSTGRSTGPHLHFEVIINGSKVNALNYIR